MEYVVSFDEPKHNNRKKVCKLYNQWVQVFYILYTLSKQVYT